MSSVCCTNSMAVDALARRIRARVLTMACMGRSSHVASCLSCADILAVLYGRVLQVDPQAPTSPDRDRFILSKGHAAMALYATLAERGLLDPAELDSFGTRGSILEGHANEAVPGVEASTGSLGHGLSIGAGMVLGGAPRVFVLLSDGECQEGSVWEAADFAARMRLSRLTAIVDANGWQATERCDTSRLPQKWAAFGWDVLTIDGHDVRQLAEALQSDHDQPLAVIAKTVKGKGVPFMEDRLEWHYRWPDEAELAKGLAALGVC